nr:hypothetical protein [Tanacetum cinerariifolium]
SLVDVCRDLDPYVDFPVVLVAFSFGALVDSGSFPSLRLLDPRNNDDSTFRVDIESRLPVDRKSVELLTFVPPMRYSPESMLVVAYWFLNPHCARHQVFNPLDSSANIIERPITEFVQFINPHQLVLLIFIMIDESSWIGVSGVSFLVLQIRSVHIRPCEVELLLVAFDTELKVFYTPLDYDASCKNSKRDVESKAFFDRQFCQLSLNQKQ